MKSGAAGLTRKGWVLLVIAGVMGIAAFLFGVQELYPVAAAGIVLVAACRAWVASQAWDLQVTRHIHPARVPAGNEARVELTARNHCTRRSPLVVASDPFDKGKRWAHFSIGPMAPGETRTASYRLPTSRRGIFQLGPLRLEVNDPFGFARVVRSSTPDASLTVHPRVEAVTAHSMSAHSDRDTRLPLPVLGRGGDEFYGLRAYEPGDDLRLVHWASTARVDDVMIRQPENLWRGRVTVVVDSRVHVHDSESLDAVLSGAASIASAGMRGGLHVRLITTEGVDTGFGSGNAHGAAMLDALAAAGTHPSVSLADGMRGIRTGDPVTLVTTDGATRSDIASACRIGGTFRTTVVIFERARGRSTDLDGFATSSGGRIVRVAPGGSFRAAWEGVEC